MATAALKIHLSRTQILELARQLSDEDKLELNRALAAEVRGIKLKRLLDDLKTDEVLQEDIDSEVETVRQGRLAYHLYNSRSSRRKQNHIFC